MDEPVRDCALRAAGDAPQAILRVGGQLGIMLCPEVHTKH